MESIQLGYQSAALSASPVATEVSSSPPVLVAFGKRASKMWRTDGTYDEPPVRNTVSMAEPSTTARDSSASTQDSIAAWAVDL